MKLCKIVQVERKKLKTRNLCHLLSVHVPENGTVEDAVNCIKIEIRYEPK